MSEGMLDLLVGIIVLGMVISIAFGSVIPLVQTSYSDKISQMYDKTVMKTLGEDVSQIDNYDGCMDKLEAVLVTQVIDYGMPEPKAIKIDNLTINITSTYREELINYALSLWGQIRNDSTNTRYRYDFDYGNANTQGDETYTLSRK